MQKPQDLRRWVGVVVAVVVVVFAIGWLGLEKRRQVWMTGASQQNAPWQRSDWRTKSYGTQRRLCQTWYKNNGRGSDRHWFADDTAKTQWYSPETDSKTLGYVYTLQYTDGYGLTEGCYGEHTIWSYANQTTQQIDWECDIFRSILVGYCIVVIFCSERNCNRVCAATISDTEISSAKCVKERNKHK